MKDETAGRRTASTRLKPVAHDDFETVHPDELIAHISRAPIMKTGLLSLGLHIAVIALLSIGNFALCAKYNTLDVKGAVAEQAKALKAEKLAAQKVEREARQAEQKAKRDAKAKKEGKAKGTAGEEKKDAAAGAKPGSAMEDSLKEVSPERPTGSSVNLDDIDDGL